MPDKKFELTTLDDYIVQNQHYRFFIYEDMAELMQQLSPQREWRKSVSFAQFLEFAKSETVETIVAVVDNEVVGTGTLNVCFRPSNVKGEGMIDDVVVHEEYRGRGIGEAIVRELLRIGSACGVTEFSLTSQNHRIEAHKLYEKLGFKKHDTNTFVLNL